MQPRRGSAPIAPARTPPGTHGTPTPQDPYPWVRRAMGAQPGAGRAARSRPRCSAQLVIVTFGIGRFHWAQ